MLAGKQVKPGLILDAVKKAGYSAVIHDDYVSANDILLTTTDKTFPIPSYRLKYSWRVKSAVMLTDNFLSKANLFFRRLPRMVRFP